MTHPATLLKNSWRAYARNFRAWLIITAPFVALGATMIVLTGLMPQKQDGLALIFGSSLWAMVAAMIGVLIALAAIILVIRAVSTAMIIASYHSLNGQKPNIKESLMVGWRTFWPVLWVAILRGLIVLGGLILLVVPGIIWALRYSLAVQVTVIEGKKSMDALRRSRELTNGKLFETFVNFGVIGAIVGYGTWLILVATMVVFVILGTIVSLAVPSDAYNGIYLTVTAIVIAAEAIVIWFAIPLSPLAITAVYKDFSDK